MGEEPMSSEMKSRSEEARAAATKAYVTIRLPVRLRDAGLRTGFFTDIDPEGNTRGVGVVNHDGNVAYVEHLDIWREICAAWPTEPTTDRAKRLAEIDARTTAATKGPWFDSGYRDSDDFGPHVETEGEATVAMCALNVSEHRANGPFIAHAREDVPFLLAEIRAADAALSAAGIPDDGRPLAERLRGIANDAQITRNVIDGQIHNEHQRAGLRHDLDILKRAARAAAITLGEDVPEDAGPETIATALRSGVDATQAALRTAKVLAANGTLGEAAEDILRAADMLRRWETGATGEYLTEAELAEIDGLLFLLQGSTAQKARGVIDRLAAEVRTLRAEQETARAALSALGHPVTATIAAAIKDAHEETMRHLHVARAELAARPAPAAEAIERHKKAIRARFRALRAEVRKAKDARYKSDCRYLKERERAVQPRPRGVPSCGRGSSLASRARNGSRL